MNPTVQQIESILAAAVELGSEAERHQFVERACAGDAELRRRVDELIDNHFRAGNFLGSLAPQTGATVEELIGERPGTIIGAYKLLEQIGEGGFGVVFMAQQQEPIRRKVALKVIKPGMDTRQVVARFEAERQALALMDHPNIAHILDGGETASGRPYFVMELIRGIPITAFCDQNRLPVSERLELFASTCQAVQHAHQKGIIHRDLKPSNILVTLHDDKPVVKVIDFGIAKALGQQLTEKTLFTNFAQMIGTPLYMSPEQAQMSGLDIDTRSDIYSLGVLLYELLTGTTPFDRERLRAAGYDEMRRIIREEEPARPSTRMSTLGQAAATVSANRQSEPHKLSQLFKGELDWIAMKALEKDRNRRFESASAFAGDVHRYQHDEPVQACPPSAWYRFRKFARRNRAVVGTATAGAVAVLLAVGSLVSAVRVLAASNTKIQAEQQQTKEALEREMKARDQLLQALKREQRTLYFQWIALTERERAANNRARAEELLEGCPLELRGWEWYYLKRRSHQEPLTIRGHSFWVTGVAFSPDGKLVASASSLLSGTLGEVKVWDRTTGKEVHHFLDHAGPAVSVAFSPDGKRLASAGWDRTVKVRDLVGGKEPHTLRGHAEHVSDVAFSPDGKLLASASGDRTIMIWDATTFAKRLTLHGHTRGLNCVVFSSDSRRLASASYDGTVRVWDARTGQEVHVLRGHAGAVLGVAFSPDGQQLASSGLDGSVRVWDAATGRESRTIQAPTILISSVAFSPDGKRLATGSVEKAVRLWDLETGEEALTLWGHDDMVTRVTFSPDGQQLASVSLDGTVRVWDATPVKTGPEVLTLRGHTGGVLSVAFRPDGKRLATASFDETAKLWDETGAEIRVLKGHSGPVARVVFSSDSRLLVSADFAGSIRVWEATTGKEVRTFRSFGGNVALSPDGQRLASAEEGGTVFVWNMATGKEELSFRGHVAPINSIAFSPDGRRLATASWDDTTKVWDATTGRMVFTLRGHHHFVHHMVFSADGKRLATASWDRTAKVWDATTGKELVTLGGHEDRVLSVDFSPDGKRLATASWDNTVKIWNAASGKVVATLRGHTGGVLSATYSPDGKRLATASGYRGKGEVKIWDATQWEEKPGRSTPGS
jgi:eukaryotic-like serine/threonine-protein kinase